MEETILWDAMNGKTSVHSGLYFLYEGTDDVLYIGQSTSFKRRLRQHLWKSGDSPVGDYLRGKFPYSFLWSVKLIGTDECRTMFGSRYILACENKAIRQFRPRFNVVGQRDVRDSEVRQRIMEQEVELNRVVNDRRRRQGAEYKGLELF